MARAKMEGGFAEVLKSLTPSQKLFELAKVMFRDAWDMRLTQTHAQQANGKPNSRLPRSRSRICSTAWLRQEAKA